MRTRGTWDRLKTGVFPLSFLGFLCLFLFQSSAVLAHELRPAYLELRQSGPETYDVLWKVPGMGENLHLGLYVEFPADCTNVIEPRAAMIRNAFTQRWTVRRAGGLDGSEIHIRGLSATMTDVLVRMEHLDGRAQVTRLTPSAPSLIVQSAPGPMEVARTYSALGIEHILTGIDHLRGDDLGDVAPALTPAGRDPRRCHPACRLVCGPRRLCVPSRQNLKVFFD